MKKTERGIRGKGERVMIPILSFGWSTFKEESEGWKEMSKKVREAGESHGCFFLVCDEISSELREQMFINMKTLFDLPEEIKRKHVSPIPYRGYQKKIHVIPYSETFGLDDANLPATTQAFTHLMWPQGNQSFCDTLNSISSKILKLSSIILKMIVESYGLPKHYNSEVEAMRSTSDSRMLKYEIPEKDTKIAMVPHTDKGSVTILCENEVQGLQLFNKSGEWVNVKIPPNGFIVIFGDILRAWSNGRLQAAKHRVVIHGDQHRYSFVVFSVPKEDMIIKVPPELVDEENPLRFRPFKYAEYLDYHFTNRIEDRLLEEYAGINK